MVLNEVDMSKQNARVLRFEYLSLDDVMLVGGKNANLGELTRIQNNSTIQVPLGFALTTFVYREFIENNNIDQTIDKQLKAFDQKKQNLQTTGSAIRAAILKGTFNQKQKSEIVSAYKELCESTGERDCAVAVRSSATAEDLPEASFAGQQESYLNVQGAEALLSSCRLCFSSLFTDRAIAYRQQQRVDNEGIALSVGIQQMVRSDLACAGVMFSIDTETGFPHGVLINGSWGLGESVVKGSVTPDRYMVFKPLLCNKRFKPIIEKYCGSKLEKMVYLCADDQLSQALIVSTSDKYTRTISTTEQEQKEFVLSDDEILQLANWATDIERIYAKPMDIEWAKDGITGNIYIVQARPETIESRKDNNLLKTYRLKQSSTALTAGASVGNAIVCGQVCYLSDPAQTELFPDGAILVTERTDPDWVPIMKKAAGIITDLGGTTSHAAIVSRELQVPAIVGTGDATQILNDASVITLDCASSSIGTVYLGKLEYDTRTIHLDEIPATKTEVMINIAVPDGAMRWWHLPTSGIGLSRIEFIIANIIKAHPMALIHPELIADPVTLKEIYRLMFGYKDGAEYFVDTLARGVAKIAASCHPKPVIVRFSDFKTNEYRSLLGGEYFENEEENPMLGLRGASRYYHPSYREAFKLECKSIKKVRETMGFENVVVMIPFCRTPDEADKVLSIMDKYGLQRGQHNLQIYMMCEVPSNVILADQFAEKFDGFSIGSNDLTQLVLGIDRDSSELKSIFDPTNEAVKHMISDVIRIAHQHNIKIGICGQAPSDHPDFTDFLVQCGIDSISLNPDSVATVINDIAAVEQIFTLKKALS
jgi:pyruvate,water dikinase